MKKYVMDIELLSDLCVSDGSVYNSSIDTEICCDELGIPYIPARRIKGCLHECALELNDWGIAVRTERIFGKEGNQSGSVRINSAYPVGYREYRREILANPGSIVTHPQNVLREFSYVRTQTAVDYETGTALDHSLRRMRVADRGLHFEAEITMPEQDFFDVERCCTILKHMGNARTRGLGEVSVTLRKMGEDRAYAASHVCPWREGSTRLEYEITLLEPLLCKNVSGEEKSADYIEGAKILGLIAQASKRDGEEAFLNLMAKGEMICSNAYLSHNGLRMSPVPACFFTVKNHKEQYVDKSCTGFSRNEAADREESNIRQLNRMKNCYVLEDDRGKLLCRTVETEERYHHRRPEDKSIGRALGGGIENGVLYQISSVSAGQKLKGLVEGSPEQVKQVYDYWKRMPRIHMGAGRSAEYGSAELEVTKVSGEEAHFPVKAVKDIVVKLEAPVILYGDHAAYTTDGETLIEEISCVLGLEGMDYETECYVDTVTIGGYHVTWGMKKPVIEAFDKGTVICYHMKEPIEIPAGSRYWIGERISEGFGEVLVKEADAGDGEKLIAEDRLEMGKKLVDVSSYRFLTQICNHLFEEYLAASAVRAVKERTERTKDLAVQELYGNIGWFAKTAMNPTVSNMLVMCGEIDTFDGIYKACEDRFLKNTDIKEEKWEISRQIIVDCINMTREIRKKFETEYGITGYNCSDDSIKRKFLEVYLREIKYALRSMKGVEI